MKIDHIIKNATHGPEQGSAGPGLPPGGEVAGGVPAALELGQAGAAAVGAVTVHWTVPALE